MIVTSATFKVPYPPIGSLPPSAPYFPPPIDIPEPEVRDIMDHKHHPDNYIPRYRWTHTHQSSPRLYLNTYVWVCHPYESKPELGRIINIEDKTFSPNGPTRLIYTVMKQRLDDFNWCWVDTYTGVYDRDEMELVDLVSQGLAYIGRYLQDPRRC